MRKERRLVASGLAAGAAALIGITRESQAGQRPPDTNVIGVLRDILAELERQRTGCRDVTCPAVERIRENQRVYFKAQGRFPEIIEIGIDVWNAVWDWHVTTRQRVEPVRSADGRLGMSFILTTLVVRHDVVNDFVSVGFDR